MSDYDLNELLATFMAEAEDDITALEAALLALEQTPGNAELHHELLRHAHTIKGNASCVGLQAVTAFAHAYEEKLEDFSVQLDVPLLLTGIDAFRRLIVSDTLTAGDQALIAALQHDGASPAAAPAQAQAQAPAEARLQVPARAHVRVAASKLNRMLDLAGEIAIARGRVRQLLAVRPIDAEALAEVESQVDQLQGQLQESIMRARMVPVGPTFRQYERTVRDVAAAHGKNARLLTLGDEVELDTSAVELLRDPLTHMIRNAIDHGLETSAARVAAGKTPVGHITLEAHHDAGSVIIRVSDDGAGLDREAIAARAGRAVENGSESESDLDRLIFEPGFTTSEEVTDLSGRGVGMDVVRRTIESLRGTITVASTKGEGTSFTIRLPLTLAVIDGFGVRAGDETYLVPLDHVVECVELPEASRGDDATGVLLLRDEIVPFVRLRHHFHAGGAAPARENILIVQVHGAKGLAKAGLAVDELHGASQAVIKPLGGYFSGVPGVSGSSILGNGRVALILDTPAILRSLEGAAAR
jgi:two-component system chemotaxis sensor kinase CheA